MRMDFKKYLPANFAGLIQTGRCCHAGRKGDCEATQFFATDRQCIRSQIQWKEIHGPSSSHNELDVEVRVLLGLKQDRMR